MSRKTIKRDEVSPIVNIHLGGCPPPSRSLLWWPVCQEILEMPMDGTWLRIELRESGDIRRCRDAVDKWLRSEASRLVDCRVEFVLRPADRCLWVRKLARVAGGGRQEEEE